MKWLSCDFSWPGLSALWHEAQLLGSIWDTLCHSQRNGYHWFLFGATQLSVHTTVHLHCFNDCTIWCKCSEKGHGFSAQVARGSWGHTRTDNAQMNSGKIHNEPFMQSLVCEKKLLIKSTWAWGNDKKLISEKRQLQFKLWNRSEIRHLWDQWQCKVTMFIRTVKKSCNMFLTNSTQKDFSWDGNQDSGLSVSTYLQKLFLIKQLW